MTLLNTEMKREVDHLAKFFRLAVDYKKKIGFTGQFLIEPKPKEPTSRPLLRLIESGKAKVGSCSGTQKPRE